MSQGIETRETRAQNVLTRTVDILESSGFSNDSKRDALEYLRDCLNTPVILNDVLDSFLKEK